MTGPASNASSAPLPAASRLPGHTGTNAGDIRRALADPKGKLRL
jgi:hypothetical protein